MMTDKSKSADGLELSPIQADRDAARDIFLALGREQSARLAELGWGGVGPVALICARHRLSAQPAREDALREADVFQAIHDAMQDERDGKPVGCIVVRGCEAAEYADPENAADAFKADATSRVLTLLSHPPQPAQATDHRRAHLDQVSERLRKEKAGNNRMTVSVESDLRNPKSGSVQSDNAGQVFNAAVSAQQAQAGDGKGDAGERVYVIEKHGAFYRPDAAGYTSEEAEAGLFTLEDAISYSHPNGLDGPRDGITYRKVKPAALRAQPAQPDAENPYQLAWREMFDHLSWMQGHSGLQAKYLGWNFADVASDLIADAYPEFREAIRASKEGEK